MWGRFFVLELQVCNKPARFWGKIADRQFISENTQDWSSIFPPAKVFLQFSLHLFFSHQSNQMKLPISRVYLRIKSANYSKHFMQLVKYDSVMSVMPGEIFKLVLERCSSILGCLSGSSLRPKTKSFFRFDVCIEEKVISQTKARFLTFK